MIERKLDNMEIVCIGKLCFPRSEGSILGHMVLI